jgi:hypothetical protein
MLPSLQAFRDIDEITGRWSTNCRPALPLNEKKDLNIARTSIQAIEKKSEP